MSDKSFTVHGNRNGSVVWVRWDDGTLSGDPPTMYLVETEAALERIRHRDPAARAADLRGSDARAPLSDAATAHELICAVFDSVRKIEGWQPPQDNRAAGPVVKGRRRRVPGPGQSG